MGLTYLESDKGNINTFAFYEYIAKQVTLMAFSFLHTFTFSAASSHAEISNIKVRVHK